MTKKEMVDRLVADSVDTALNGGMNWLKELFEEGFKGFQKMHKRELKQELLDRGLIG